MNRSDEPLEQKQPEPIDLTVLINDFFRILRRKWHWMLLAALLLGTLVMMVQERRYVPYYTASATYAVTTYDGNASNVYQDHAAAQQAAATSPYLLTSNVLQRKAAEKLGVSGISGTIRASVMENTNFLTISLTDTDAVRAYETLQAVQQVYPALAESVMGKIYMEIMDETGVPAAVDNPRSRRADFVKGALLGAVLTAAAVILLAFTNGTIRREEDCVRRINTKCLGCVPRVQRKVRSKKQEQHLNILRRNTDPELIEAFRNLRNKIERKAGREQLKTVLVTSTLPGEGKSTIAVNTALSLMRAGKKVALVDCDLRNPSDGGILNAPEGSGLIDFLSGNAKFSDCVLSGRELFGSAAPFLFIRGGKAVADGSGYLSTEKMKKLVDMLEKEMDYVILDTPPSGLLTDAGILAQYVGGVVFVVKKDFAKTDRILEAMEHVTQGNSRILGCVLNDDN